MSNRGNRATPETRGAEALASYRAQQQGERIQHAGGSGGARRPRRALELEDYLLAGWILAAEALVVRWYDNPLVLMDEFAGGDGTWLGWLAGLSPTGWVIITLFLFVLLTRGREDTDRDVAIDRRTPMLALATPLLSIYALVASAIRDALYGTPDLAPGAQPPWPGPLVPSVVRRTAAVPIGFIGDALFRSEIANTELGALSIDSLSSSPITILVAVASAFPFMIFVAGPRIAAGGALAWRPWIFRFLLFLAATVARNSGLTW